ncbi:MAG TPA: hypothetical protein VHF25_08440 [Nitriliruptorales bacterium]|nr:hypothetical protein [Nitriliruptorales bacterium]
MPVAAIVTLIGTAATVAVLALYLTKVALDLRHVNFTVGTIIAGLRAIANQTEPLGPVVDEINADLAAIREQLERLVEMRQEQQKSTTTGGRRRSRAGH